MRVRKVCHNRSKTSTPKVCEPLNLTKLLNKQLSQKYNHSNKHFYLKQFQQSLKKRQAVFLKDYDAINQQKEVLQKYIDQYDYDALFQQAIGYYKYYQDIPRIFNNRFQSIILKHIEAKRIKMYTDLNLVQNTSKDHEITQTYSNFMPLLLEQTNKPKKLSEDSTLLCLKEQLSFALEQKQWIQNIQSLKKVQFDDFTNLNLQKWNKFIYLKNIKIKQIRRYWGSMQFNNNTKAQLTNTNQNQPLIKKSTLKMKTFNFSKRTHSQEFLKQKQTLLQCKQNNSKHKSNKSQIKTPSINNKNKISHIRMYSQPFQVSKSVNCYLKQIIETQKKIEASKVKKKRKQLQTSKKL